MKSIPAFAFIIVLVAVWPLLLVGMSVLERKGGLRSQTPPNGRLQPTAAPLR